MDIQKIISEMTLEEKAGLCSGLNFWETKPIERLGVPSIMMTDGPHGLRKQAGESDHLGIMESVPATCFPTAVGTAASFDREALKEMGNALADECIAENVAIILGPGANIKRSPLCGRNFEYFSEDPYLTGEMAAAHIQGVQSKGVGTSMKHYAANNQENRRNTSSSEVDERTLHEIYLSAFEGAVRNAQPTTIMCSYNRVNGVYASENHYLLTEVLRDKWGFEGLVVSDWGAVNERVKGLAAGLEWEMPTSGGAGDAEIVKAVKDGELPMETLDLAVTRILKVIERVTGEKPAVTFDKDKHNALARKLAADSMVLLKNDDNILPLKAGQKIAFIGEYAETPRYQGAGSSMINPPMITSSLEAVKEICEVTYAKGFPAMSHEPDESLILPAVEAAKNADICVVFAGLPPSYESEGYDRDHMNLPPQQNQVIAEIAKVCKNVVVVLQNGSPVEMPWVNEVSAVLEAYLGGQAAGGAIVDLLFGKVNPNGKLAETFPVRLKDNPSYLYYQGEGDVTEYREGIFVGYRYYDKKDIDVLFPFGHGLSYTTFEYSNLKISKGKIKDTETVEVSVDVKNTGSMAGKEIVQIYVGKKCQDVVIRPVRELRGFDKVSLNPGETRTVTLTLSKCAFTYWNTTLNDWHVESGEYIIEAGKSSRDIVLSGSVEVESTVRVPVNVTLNTCIADIAKLPGGQEFVAELTKNMGGNPMAAMMEDSDQPKGPMATAMLEMMNRIMGAMPLRSMLTFSPGAFDKNELQAILDKTFNS